MVHIHIPKVFLPLIKCAPTALAYKSNMTCSCCHWVCHCNLLFLLNAKAAVITPNAVFFLLYIMFCFTMLAFIHVQHPCTTMPQGECRYVNQQINASPSASQPAVSGDQTGSSALTIETEGEKAAARQKILCQPHDNLPLRRIEVEINPEMP